MVLPSRNHAVIFQSAPISTTCPGDCNVALALQRHLYPSGTLRVSSGETKSENHERTFLHEFGQNINAELCVDIFP